MAGDVFVTAACDVDNDAAIIAAVSGVAVVADDIVAVPCANGLQVRFVIVQA